MEVWHTEAHLTQAGRALPFDSDRMHRILTWATGGPRFLWAHPRAGVLIIQSDAALPPELWRGIATSVRSSRAPTSFPQGSLVELSGIVCPTTSSHDRDHPTPGRPDGRTRRKPLDTDQVPAWLQRRFNGAARLEVDQVEDLAPGKGTRPDGSVMWVTRRAFHAWATVADPDMFAQLLHDGIGRGKRFGAGLVLAKEATR
jgi:hypothetical protein